MILPRDGGTYQLVYTARVATAGRHHALLHRRPDRRRRRARSDAHRQSASVGLGIGVLGGRKKVSASSQGGTFVGSDRLRPPVIETYDMRGNLTRTINFLNGVVNLNASDFASDSDNEWTDGANVDAHVYAGYTYDYYFKRFGRRGLDNANIRIRSLTHPVNRQDAFTASSSVSRHLLPERVLRRRRHHGLRRGTAAEPDVRRAAAGTSSPARSTWSPTSSLTASPTIRRT